jgi:hypothetical protein
MRSRLLTEVGRVLRRHPASGAILLLAGVALALGWWGYSDARFEDARSDARFADAPDDPPNEYHELDWLYFSLQLFVLESPDVKPDVPWQLQSARLLAAFVAGAAVVQAILALSARLRRRIKVALTRGHVVVCGLGERGTLLAKRFPPGEAVVAIEADEHTSGVEECREARATVIIGDATDESVLRKAGIEKARYLVAVSRDDGVNAEIAAGAAKLVAGRRPDPLEAFIHIVDPTLANLLREQERTAPGRESFRLRYFNVYEAGARAWLGLHPPFGTPETWAGERPHLAIVGLGELGKALLLGAVRSWLAMSVASRSDGRGVPQVRPRITLVDREAGRKREWVDVEFPQFDRYCQLLPCELDVTSPQFRRAEFLLDCEGRPDVSSVYVCMDDDGTSLTAALTLHDRLQDAARRHRTEEAVRVVVRLRRYAGLATLLGSAGEEDGARARPYGSLRAFTLLDLTCTPDFLLGRTPNERLAKAIHGVYVRMRREAGDTIETNPSMAPWDELPEALKESNRRQADHARVKLRMVGFELAGPGDDDAGPISLSEDEIERLARMEHDRFEVERRFEGWTEGPRDPLAKTSPYLVEWERLPTEIRNYDVEFVRHLPGALAEAGLKVRPLSEDRNG